MTPQKLKGGCQAAFNPDWLIVAGTFESAFEEHPWHFPPFRNPQSLVLLG